MFGLLLGTLQKFQNEEDKDKVCTLFSDPVHPLLFFHCATFLMDILLSLGPNKAIILMINTQNQEGIWYFLYEPGPYRVPLCICRILFKVTSIF